MPLAFITDDGIYHIHSDHLSTPQKLTDENQQIVWDAVYEPFGQVTLATELVTFNPRFPGQYFDQETGLHYNYFRDYDPTIGRYVQSDPIGLMGGLNTYVYANGNTLVNLDPKGLTSTKSILDAINSAIDKAKRLPSAIGGALGELIPGTQAEGAALECANSFRCEDLLMPGLTFFERALAKCIKIFEDMVPPPPPQSRGGMQPSCATKCKEKLENKCAQDPQACLSNPNFA